METITTQSRGYGFVEVNQEFFLDETPRTKTVFKAAMHSGGIRGDIIRYREKMPTEIVKSLYQLISTLFMRMRELKLRYPPKQPANFIRA